MAVFLPTPEQSRATFNVSFGGSTYDIEYKFNERDKRWRVSLSRNGEPFIVGVKVVETQDLLTRYQLPEFTHGTIFCLRLKDTEKPVGRNNLGYGKDYALIYFSYEELEDGAV